MRKIAHTKLTGFFTCDKVKLKFHDYLASLSITLWVGGLWSIGYLAVPVLFQLLTDKMLAGFIAGRMFSLIAYIGLACSILLMGYLLKSFGRNVYKQRLFQVLLCMLLLNLAGLFIFQPLMAGLKSQAFPADVMHSVFAEQFKMLHGVSSILYLVQSLLGIWLVLFKDKIIKTTY
jgi:hypothetical protein